MQQFGVYKVAEIRQSQRSFLLMTYKLYDKLSDLSGSNKSNCLNVMLALLKYAWKSSDYKCAIRYSTISKETKLSKMTIRRTCSLLSKLNIITIKRLSSANYYSINTSYLKAEVSKLNTQKAKYGASVGINLNTINKSISTLVPKGKIDKIISDNRSNKDVMIRELIKHCTLEELKEDKNNVYYCGLAIAEYDKKLGEEFVPPEKIINALKNMKKNNNAFYKAKKEYNIRNNLDWKGNPKK